MERSALYRRALAPIMTFVGVLGLAAGIVGWRFGMKTDPGFVLYWSGVATVALIGTLLLVRRQALKDREPFWSPPTRRIGLSMLPAMAVGAFVGVMWLLVQPGNSGDLNLIVMIWACLYGLALHSAGFVISSGVRTLGWLFCLISCSIPIVLTCWGDWKLPPHLAMAGIFGGLHLASGIYLYFTEKGKNAA